VGAGGDEIELNGHPWGGFTVVAADLSPERFREFRARPAQLSLAAGQTPGVGVQIVVKGEAGGGSSGPEQKAKNEQKAGANGWNQDGKPLDLMDFQGI
jgi:hypothetical protein